MSQVTLEPNTRLLVKYLQIALIQPRTVHLPIADYFGVLYLLLPTLLFFSLYTVHLVAIPCSLAILYFASRLRIYDNKKTSDVKLALFNLAVSVLVVFLSGAFGPLYVNTDWYKHYSLFNELATQGLLDNGDITIRYYIGAYIVPSLFDRALGFSNGFAFGAWLVLGLWIFFNQVEKLILSKALKYCAPFIFIMFSGADIIGYYLTKFERGGIDQIEWWAGWIEYSSSLTSIFWAPQSTIPAWIAMAFLMRRPPIEQKLFVSPLIIMSCLLWSPFIALGVAPFLVLTLTHKNFRIVNLNIPYFIAIAAISMFVCYYLTYDISGIPKSFIWNNPCLIPEALEPCFSLQNYFTFILLEFGLISASILTFTKTRSATTIISLLLLILLPLIKIGEYNDIALNTSKPALCAIAISLIIAFQESKTIQKIVITVIFLIGSITPLCEIYRSVSYNRKLSANFQLSTFIVAAPKFASQYITHGKIWFIKEGIK